MLPTEQQWVSAKDEQYTTNGHILEVSLSMLVLMVYTMFTIIYEVMLTLLKLKQTSKK